MTCDQCEHAVGRNWQSMHPQAPYWFCGHYDVMELDSNDGGKPVGFSTEPPDWCPLQGQPVKTEKSVKPVDGQRLLFGEPPDAES